jgi:flavin reductase (DIM6/NTAB) family NADH-FMN oxidoreductase RutF
MGVPGAGPVLDLLATSCVVITTIAGSEPRGCLIASVMPIGFQTPRFLLAFDEKSSTCRAIESSAVLGLHMLRESDAGIARVFATGYDRPADRFEHVTWRLGHLGVPLIDGGHGGLEARVVSRGQVTGCVLVEAQAVFAYGQVEPGYPQLTIEAARRAGLEQPRPYSVSLSAAGSEAP